MYLAYDLLSVTSFFFHILDKFLFFCVWNIASFEYLSSSPLMIPQPVPGGGQMRHVHTVKCW